jgi:hypothetical protein
MCVYIHGRRDVIEEMDDAPPFAKGFGEVRDICALRL